MNIPSQIIFSQMPAHYLFCYAADCPLRDDCLHHLAAIHGHTAEKVVRAVNPQLCSGGDCPYHRPVRIVRMAYGMTRLYDKVMAKDVSGLRRTISEHFGGGGSYYLRRNGKMPITPEEQTWIAEQFQRFGYNCTPDFDKYASEVEW